MKQKIFFIILIIISLSCKKNDKQTIDIDLSKTKIHTIKYTSSLIGEGTVIDTFQYNSNNKLIRYSDNLGDIKIYEYNQNDIKIITKKYSEISYFMINPTNSDGYVTKMYGNNLDTAQYTLYFYKNKRIERMNNDSLLYYDNNLEHIIYKTIIPNPSYKCPQCTTILIDTISFEYYPNTSNTIYNKFLPFPNENKYIGIDYWGEPSQNLVKKVHSSISGDLLNCTYEFDSYKRVSKMKVISTDKYEGTHTVTYDYVK